MTRSDVLLVRVLPVALLVLGLVGCGSSASTFAIDPPPPQTEFNPFAAGETQEGEVANEPIDSSAFDFPSDS